MHAGCVLDVCWMCVGCVGWLSMPVHRQEHTHGHTQGVEVLSPTVPVLHLGDTGLCCSLRPFPVCFLGMPLWQGASVNAERGAE